MNAKRRYRRKLRDYLELLWYAFGPPDQLVVRWYRPSRFQLEHEAELDAIYRRMRRELGWVSFGQAGERKPEN